jgi:hypothetical protein
MIKKKSLRARKVISRICDCTKNIIPIRNVGVKIPSVVSSPPEDENFFYHGDLDSFIANNSRRLHCAFSFFIVS